MARLTPAELEELVTRAQGGDDDALSALYSRFMPLIHKVARKYSSKMDKDDAYGVAQLRFVEVIRAGAAVRSYASWVSYMERAMSTAVMEASRTQRGIVAVPAKTAEKYYEIMRQAEGDLHTAYMLCAAGHPLMTAHTFLAANEALNSSDHALNGPVGVPVAPKPAEASSLSSDVLRWLWGEVSAEQEVIMRLAYGFRDSRSEMLRGEHGFREGTPLIDREISGVVGGSGRQIKHKRYKGLEKMRNALLTAMEDNADA